MTGLTIDPTDPTKAIIKYATDPMLGFSQRDVTIHNIHLADQCAGHPCVIHNPSDHHMREWPLLWRDDTGLFERLCFHEDRGGCGHPDPDQFAFWQSTGQGFRGSHGCDGCCMKP